MAALSALHPHPARMAWKVWRTVPFPFPFPFPWSPLHPNSCRPQSPHLPRYTRWGGVSVGAEQRGTHTRRTQQWHTHTYTGRLRGPGTVHVLPCMTMFWLQSHTLDRGPPQCLLCAAGAVAGPSAHRRHKAVPRSDRTAVGGVQRARRAGGSVRRCGEHKRAPHTLPSLPPPKPYLVLII